MDFINTFKEKDKLFLLTDYELLKQQYNGLDIIEKTQISRAVLVTSHHANWDIQARSMSMDTRILPKQLASEVAIVVEPVDNSVQKTDMVIVDDDRNFADTLKDYVFFDYHVETYYCPEDILSNISSYSKETTFLVDYEFQSSAISGLDVAQELLRRGYSRIFILSGHNSLPIETPVPNSVTVLCKTDFNAIKNVMLKKTSA
ncbi:MAG: hypothetical protein AAGB35_09245 [Pseudomonadota bacterium]